MLKLKMKTVIAVLAVLVLMVAFSSVLLATNDDNRTVITDPNSINTINTINNTTNNTNTTNTNTNVTNYNNTVANNTTTLPQTGLDYSLLIVIGLFAISAVYAYTRIRKYRT